MTTNRVSSQPADKAAAATVEAQPDEGRHPGVLPATSSGDPKEGPGILPGTPEGFGAAETQPLRVPRRPRERERRG